MRYLDAVALARLRNLRLDLSRFASEGRASGRHRSAWRGTSQEFAQHRAYTPGDPLKSIDWKVYARADRFYVRQYHSENLLAAYILVDASASMAFKHRGAESKWERACRLAMALAYLVAAEGDAVGLATFDERLRDFIPPRASMGQLDLLDAALSGAAASGRTGLPPALREFASRLKRRSLVVLVSDLMGDPEEIAATLRAFKAQRQELLVLQVLDPAERDLDFEGAVVFEGLEDGERLSCQASEIRRAYAHEFERTLKLYEASFHRAEIAYAAFYTDMPWDSSLSRFLGRL